MIFLETSFIVNLYVEKGKFNKKAKKYGIL
jgi:hypothetical protein